MRVSGMGGRADHLSTRRGSPHGSGHMIGEVAGEAQPRVGLCAFDRSGLVRRDPPRPKGGTSAASAQEVLRLLGGLLDGAPLDVPPNEIAGHRVVHGAGGVPIFPQLPGPEATSRRIATAPPWWTQNPILWSSSATSISIRCARALCATLRRWPDIPGADTAQSSHMSIAHGRQQPKSWVTSDPLGELRAVSTARLSPPGQPRDGGPNSKGAVCGGVRMAGRKWRHSGEAASAGQRTSAFSDRERLSRPYFGRPGRRPPLGRGRALWQLCRCSSSGVLTSGVWAWSSSSTGAGGGASRTPGRLRLVSRWSTWVCPLPWWPAH